MASGTRSTPALRAVDCTQDDDALAFQRDFGCSLRGVDSTLTGKLYSPANWHAACVACANRSPVIGHWSPKQHLRGANIMKATRVTLGSSMRPCTLVLIAALTAGPLATASGQEQTSTRTLNELIVPATRRSEYIQDVPVSVTAVEGEHLAAMFEGGEDIRALATRVPSLYAESSNGRLAPRFYIRGLGNSDFDLAASQPVSIIVDEVVLENVILKSFPLFDIARAEVLRGPQGTLFGRNTPAGIVKFDTVKPSQEFSGDLGLSIGELGSTTLDGAVGGGITDTVSARVSFLYHSREDWIDNTFNGENDAMGGYDEFAYRA